MAPFFISFHFLSVNLDVFIENIVFVDAKSSDTVEDVKLKAGAYQKGWSSLYFMGRRLKEGTTMASANITSGASLNLIETSDSMLCVAFPPPSTVFYFP